MKKITQLLIALLLPVAILSQTPQMFNYQAVIRDADDELVTQQEVSLKIAILQGSSTGTVMYTETHTVETNAYGLVNLKIGDGSTSDDFTAIDWGADIYFLKISLDLAGGSSYEHMGTSQILSVPYALHAETISDTAMNEHFSAALDDYLPVKLDEAFPKVAFRAYLATDISVTTSSWFEDIFLDEVELNDGDAYDPNNGTFTAPYSGVYLFNGNVTVTNMDADLRYVTGLYVNDSQRAYLASGFTHGSNSFVYHGSSITLHLNEGDVVDLRFFSSTDSDYRIEGGRQYTSFSGALLYKD